MIALHVLGAKTRDFEMLTLSCGVLCATPFQLRKAIVAANRGDHHRVRRLGCVKTGDGVKATLIDQITPPAGPWQVRLMPEGASAVTMWGYASSFSPPPP